MKISELNKALLIIGLVFAFIVSLSPQSGCFALQNVLIDRSYRFLDALIHVLGVAALLKYTFGQDR